jgi:hypothetical protein
VKEKERRITVSGYSFESSSFLGFDCNTEAELETMVESRCECECKEKNRNWRQM